MRSLTAGHRPVIVDQIGAPLAALLAEHPAAPVVLDDPEPERPWIVPPEADILVTRAMPGWRQAPDTRPVEFPDLAWIQVMSAGIDSYPGWLLAQQPVSTGKGMTAPAIAEYVIAAILRRVKPLVEAAASPAGWTQVQLGSVAGQRLGLVGFGSIGQEVAARALPLGMDLRVLRRHAERAEGGNAFVTRIEDLLSWADHLVLAVPATPETIGIISGVRLSGARPGLHLVNVSRGELVEQAAIIPALDAGWLAFATLDVVTPEPLPLDHPLLAHPKVLVTPHVAWSSGADLKAVLARRVVAGLDALLGNETPAFTIVQGLGY